MAASDPPPRLALPLGAGLLGAASMLLELLSFRLDAGVFDWGYARLVAAVAPACGGLVAAWVASRRNPLGRADAAGAAKLASYAAAVGGAGCALTAITLTWCSTVYARQQGLWWPLAPPVVAWSVTGAGLATAMSAALRVGRDRVGRVAFGFGVGGALGALLVPAAMALGAPRALLATGLCAAAAALLFARIAVAAQPTWSTLGTLPLALGVLLAGDLGAPWLRLRTDVGRRGRIGITTWTRGGLLQIDQGTTGAVAYTLDHAPAGSLSLKEKGQKRQAFELQDMAYFINGASGAALVIASGGGREVREALDAGHPRVDAVEPSVAIARLLSGELGAESGYLLTQGERVTLRFGDGRAQLRNLRDRYERIIVVGDGAAEAPTSRLLADTERLFTVEAVAQYLARLAEPRGVLLLRVARPHLADLLATASAAADPDSLAERAVACAERKDDGVAGLLILASKLNGPERHNLEKTCKRKGLSVEFPTGEAHNGDRDREAKQRELDASLAKLRAGVAVRDDRPFLDRVPPLVDLRRAAREALRAMPARVPPKAKSKDQEASDPPPPKLTSAGIAMSAAGIAATLLLLALAAPIARGFRGAAPIPFRCAVPLFGIATGVSMVALADHLLRWLGSGDWAWPIVIPLAAIGLGIGRLLADCTREGMLARVTALSALGGAGVLGVLAVAGPKLAAATSLSLGARLTGVLVVLLVTMGLIGAPFATAMRIGGRFGDAVIGWAWGIQVSAVAFGAALAQLAARYIGVARLFLVAAVALGLASLLATARVGRARA